MSQHNLFTLVVRISSKGLIVKDIQKAGGERIITIKGVTFLNANDDHLVVKVFP